GCTGRGSWARAVPRRTRRAGPNIQLVRHGWADSPVAPRGREPAMAGSVGPGLDVARASRRGRRTHRLDPRPARPPQATARRRAHIPRGRAARRGRARASPTGRVELARAARRRARGGRHRGGPSRTRLGGTGSAPPAGQTAPLTPEQRPPASRLLTVLPVGL